MIDLYHEGFKNVLLVWKYKFSFAIKFCHCEYMHKLLIYNACRFI